MAANIIDGTALATIYRSQIADEIKKNFQHNITPPGLAVVLVGEDPASMIYVQRKREACAEVNIHSFFHHYPTDVTEETLIELIYKLNTDQKIDGILIQLPLPPHINQAKILELIDPYKDVDGFHPYNLGRLAQRRALFRPCTPYGVMKLLEHIKQPYANKHAVIIGASLIVGRPMAFELLQAGCTVTICHRTTGDIEPFVKSADILVSAVGKPSLIQGDWIKPHATIIDVGISRLANGSIVGDVEFERAKEKAAWITPVPGGVGPMTVAMLLKNTLKAAYFRIHGKDVA